MTHQDKLSEELLPCPFCGEAKFARVQPYQFPPDSEGPEWKWGHHVICDASGIEGWERGCGCSSAWAETEAEAIAAWNRRALRSATPMPGVVVKPLEWSKRFPNESMSRADTAWGIYRVWTFYDAGSWFWQYGAEADQTAPDEPTALAAAQADYEARILAALSPPSTGETGEPVPVAWVPAVYIGKVMDGENAVDAVLWNSAAPDGSRVPIYDHSSIAPPPREAVEASGWLIELRGQVPQWWYLGDDGEDGQGWTTESLKALRFARKQDAEAYIENVGWTEAFASEHMWQDRAALNTKGGE